MAVFKFRSPVNGWIEMEFKTHLRTHFTSFSDSYDTFRAMHEAMNDALHVGGGEVRFCLSGGRGEGVPEYERWEIYYNHRTLELRIFAPENHLVLTHLFESWTDFAKPLVIAVNKIRFNPRHWRQDYPDRRSFESFLNSDITHQKPA